MKVKAWIPMACLLLFCVGLLSSAGVRRVSGQSGEPAADAAGKPVLDDLSKGCVVVDAGHGARDCGKVGVNGVLEKDVNLAIALRLRTYLEENDVEVVMTREDDEPLYSENDSNKKLADMEARIAIIEQAEPDIVISIHQNSYTNSSVRGPQVFYYTASSQGQALAGILQERFDYCLGAENNTRSSKPNSDYYLILHTKAVINIVECGFMSNPAEAELLASEEYQDSVAWTLCVGILQYLSSQQEPS